MHSLAARRLSPPLTSNDELAGQALHNLGGVPLQKVSMPQLPLLLTQGVHGQHADRECMPSQSSPESRFGDDLTRAVVSTETIFVLQVMPLERGFVTLYVL